MNECWQSRLESEEASSLCLVKFKMKMSGSEELSEVGGIYSFIVNQIQLNKPAKLEPTNDLTVGWKNLNQLSHPNATLAPQARPSGEILNYSLSC